MVTLDQECSSKLILATSLHENSPHKEYHKYNPSYIHIWCRTCEYIGIPNASPYQCVTISKSHHTILQGISNRVSSITLRKHNGMRNAHNINRDIVSQFKVRNNTH